MKALLAACVFAFGLTLAYAAYLQPEWEPTRNDQHEYLALARSLALRGEYTRAGPGVQFYPEWLRAPGYPVALVPLCATVGCGNWSVAIAQGGLFAALVALTYRVARRYLDRTRAIAAAWLTAASPFIAYLAALPLSDVLAVALFIAALDRVLAVRAGATLSAAACVGLLGGALAITRPVFIPFVLVLAALTLPRVRHGVVILVLAVAVMVPWMAYAQVHFGRPLLSASGLVLWGGYFQGNGGGTSADLDAFRELALGSAQAAPVAEAGARIGLDAIESGEAAAAIREIHAFESADDRPAQSRSYAALNDSLTARTVRLIAHDPIGWIARGLSVRTLELIARDEPYRVAAASTIPFEVRVAGVAAQLVLVALALAGLVAVARIAPGPALVGAVAIAYVWLTAVPFLTEARYALPVRPLLLVLAVAGATALRPPRAVAGPVRA